MLSSSTIFFSSGRVTTYCLLLVFYTVVVMIDVWACGWLRAWLEGSRLNDFAFWHGLEGRLGQRVGALLNRRAVQAPTPAPTLPVAAAQDNHAEPAQ